ncbi:MAG TPA: hypothetical protein VM308_02600 [Sphingomicrobium sp.]|nr:hypothetical protein [Sphingomicrobium sp.]
MAQHGYLHDSYDRDDRDDDRRGRRGDSFMADRERGWRERADRDEDRGFFERIGDEARSWFRDDEDEGGRWSRGSERGSDSDEWFGGRSNRSRGMSHYGREHGRGGFQGDYGSSGRDQGGFGGRGDWEGGRRSYSASPDDHYLSWRQKQIDALDRDYQEYCRECEEKFDRDFESWRRTRRRQSASLQQPIAPGESDELFLNRPAMGATTAVAPQAPTTTVDPASTATMGEAEPQPTESTGRGRRR